MPTLLKRVHQLLCCSLILGSVGFLYWKCQFGVDLTDEAYYTLPAWKSFELGDKPYRDEFYNAPRQHDWLNKNLIAKVIPFSVLKIRRAAVLFFGATLFLFFSFLFRGRLNLLLGLAFSACLLFDVNYFFPNWSYNWWLRDSLLLHCAFFLLGFSETREPVKKIWAFLSGVFLAVAWISYHTVAPFQLLAFGCFSIWCFRRDKLFIQASLLGLLTPLVLFGIDFIWSKRFFDFWEAIHSMASLLDYQGSFTVKRFLEVVGFFPQFSFFWVFGAFLFSLRLTKRIQLLIQSACLFYLARKFIYPHGTEFVMNGFLSVSFWGSLYVMLFERDAKKTYIISLAFLTLFATSLSSVARFWATVWSLPVLWGIFLWQFQKEKNLLFSKVVLHLFILFLVKETFLFQKNFISTYYDVPLAEATTEIKSSPLTGIKTSARRAYLIEKISEFVQDKKFAFAFGDLPGAFWFGKVRSSLDTTLVDVESPQQLVIASLKKMIALHREPELFIIAKEYAWRWGMKYPPTGPYNIVPYEKAVLANGFMEYATCARKAVLLSEPELEVWLVDPSLIVPCYTNISGVKVSEKGNPSLY